MDKIHLDQCFLDKILFWIIFNHLTLQFSGGGRGVHLSFHLEYFWTKICLDQNHLKKKIWTKFVLPFHPTNFLGGGSGHLPFHLGVTLHELFQPNFFLTNCNPFLSLGWGLPNIVNPIRPNIFQITSQSL